MSKRVRESDRFYREVVEGTDDLITRVDASGTLRYVNPACARVFGHPPERLLGMSALSFVHPDDRESTRLWFQDVTTRRTPHAQIRNRQVNAATGEVRSMLWTSHFSFDPDGTLSGMIGIARDVTEMERAQDELQVVLSRIRRAYQAGKIGNWEWDLTSNELYWSEENYLIHGIDPRKVRPSYEAFLQTVDPAEHEYVNTTVAAALAEVKPLDFYYTVVKPDGTRAAIHSKADVIVDGSGKPVKIAGTIQDVTERKRDEALLRASETRTRAMLKAIPDLMFRLDRQGVFLGYKAENSDLYAQAEPSIIGKRNRDIAPAEFADLIELKIRATLDTDTLQTFEYQMDIPGRGVRDYEARMAPSGADEVTAIVRDVTERKRLEEQLRQKEKVDAVVKLAGGVAHHLNNMLSPILGYAQLLAAKIPANSPLHDFPDEIAAAASRAAELISQLLSFARRQTMTMRPLDLSDLVTKAQERLRGALGAGQKLRLDLAPALGMVHGDAGLLEQALAQLTANAAAAMPQGGTLAIATAAVSLDEAFAAARAGLRPGAYVALTVADTGCGMDDAARARVFEPFFSTNDVGHGVGLGLPMVYGIVKQHDGHIEVASAPGRGTTITIWLPVIEGAAATGFPET